MDKFTIISISVRLRNLKQYSDWFQLKITPQSNKKEIKLKRLVTKKVGLKHSVEKNPWKIRQM